MEKKRKLKKKIKKRRFNQSFQGRHC
jgi:hypothetical protein